MRGAILYFSIMGIMISACHPLPTATPHGDIRTVDISDRLASSVFEVNVGDEIRWTNTSTGPIRIVFKDRILRQISCRRNFCGYYTGGMEAILAPNDSASLCFDDAGDLQYTITLQSALPSEQMARQGSLQVRPRPEHSSP